MSETFASYLRHLWFSTYPMLVQAVLVGALFELLVYFVHLRLRRVLAPALSRDAHAEAAARTERRRIVLALPLLVSRVVLYCVGLVIVLRIFHFRTSQDVYPLAAGALVLVAVGGYRVLQDFVAGYLIHYDYLYAVGDEVTIGDLGGMVSAIELRHTRLRTRDGQEVVIRHGEVRNVVNRTGGQRRG